MPFMQGPLHGELGDPECFHCEGIHLQFHAEPVSSESECSCDECMEEEEEEEIGHILHLKERNSPKIHKDHEAKRKRLELFQQSIQKYLENVEGKTTSKTEENNQDEKVEKDSVTQQKSQIEILEARLKSKELEVCLLHMNANKLSSNIQIVQDEIRLSELAKTIPRVHSQPSNGNQNTRTVVV